MPQDPRWQVLFLGADLFQAAEANTRGHLTAMTEQDQIDERLDKH